MSNMTMNLEDHLGDIIHKARHAAGVSLPDAAQAANLSAAELELLEQSGQTGASVNLPALAQLIGLHPGRLVGIAGGWRPQPQRLERWRELRQISTTRAGNAVNCFLIWDHASSQAALFDTGWEAQPVLRLLEENRLRLLHLFITHGHHDHVAALEPLRGSVPGLVVHAGVKNQHRHEPGAALFLGQLRITARPVPGHAEDGMVYVVEDWPDDAPATAFLGDTLFAGSLAKGFVSTDLLKQKVREQIFTLPPDTLLCPGHGPVTTVGEEMTHNPFFGF